VERNVVRAVLTALLVLAACPAGAEWLKMGEVPDAVLYIDPASIREDRTFSTLSTLDDLKVAGPGGELSMRFVREFDCRQKRVRVIDASAFSGAMGTGRILGSESGGRWHDVVPGTTGEDILRFVCGG
jgi:hypothetical protein